MTDYDNPMDGHRDLYEWPYHWSRDLAGDAVSALAFLDFLYPDLDKWTYANHWHHDEESTDPSYIVDLYWSDFEDGEERLQLPPPIGDEVADLLVSRRGDAMRLLIWFGMIWTPEAGWFEWYGEQGDFVDHIHIEFDPAKL